MNSRLACFFLLILFAVALCPAQAEDKDQKAIDARRAEFVAAFNTGDAKALEKIYEPDALLLTFTGQVVIGGKGIALGMTSFSPTADLDMKPLRFRAAGDLAYEAGTWSHFKKGTKTVSKLGTYMWVWKKEKGTWLIESFSITAAPGVPIEIGS